MFCVDKMKYEHLAILSNLKSCQFAPNIVIFNLCICCQFEDSQIISPKIIPMSYRNTVTNEDSFLAVYFSLSFGTKFRNFRKSNQELLHQTTSWCGLVLNGLTKFCFKISSNNNTKSQVTINHSITCMLLKQQLINIHHLFVEDQEKHFARIRNYLSLTGTTKIYILKLLLKVDLWSIF